MGQNHAVDYTVGLTRIVCNPSSHADEATGFDLSKVVPFARCGEGSRSHKDDGDAARTRG